MQIDIMYVLCSTYIANSASFLSEGSTCVRKNLLEISKPSWIFLQLYTQWQYMPATHQEELVGRGRQCLLKIASLNKFELCWCCHKTSWQPLLFDGYLLTLQEHFLTTTISFPNENRIHSYQLYSPRVCLPLTMFMPNRPYIIIIGNNYSDYFGH